MLSEIKNEKDIQIFIEKTNSLHDGQLISSVYTDNGIEKIGDKYWFSTSMTELTLRVLVTSLQNTTVVIKFEDLIDWQLKKSSSYLFGITLSFDGQGHIVWSDGIWKDQKELERHSFVIAKSMKWRIEG
jgi:hypothetical protein